MTLAATPAETVQRIATLARAGRLDEAALLGTEAQLAKVAHPALSALMGAVEFHRGQFARALPHLQDAHARHPGDLTVRVNLAEAFYRCGQAEAALRLCDEASARADKSLRLMRLGAFLAQETGQHQQAAAFYRMAVAANPRDWESWNNLGNALSAQGDAAGAAEALRKAAELAPDSQPIRLNLGNALADAGQFDQADAVLRALAADFPDDPHPFLALAEIDRALGRIDEAFADIGEAARRAPERADIQSDFGQEAARRNAYDVAEQAFEAALKLDSKLGPAFVGLASVYERMNREAELEPLRARADAAGLDSQSGDFIDALRHKRAGEMEAAFAALERAGDVVVAGRKHHLRGTMLDRLGRHDEAFAAFTAMNEHWQADPSRPRERARLYREWVDHATALLSPEWAASWTPYAPAPTDRAAPVFLVGFPRSGTTLLDTMLMADPAVGVLEETPFIADIERDLGGVDALPDLDAETIARARAAYFERVGALVDLSAKTIIVDKHPMHLNKVAVIRRLFPEARFVLILRHPCDVLLSCFITNFRINNAMSNFLDLGDAATLYDQTFAHWEKAREVFGLDVSTVVYERLVEDTARELRPVFETLGLAWPEGELDHREAARARGTVSTASYSQVTEPIYKRAAGRWHRYASHLAPVLPRLAPWVDRFGYALEDGRYPPFPETDG